MTNQIEKLTRCCSARAGVACLLIFSFVWAATAYATTNSDLAGVYETGQTDGMSWAYSITLQADGNASLKEPRPLPDGDGKTIEMQGIWQASGQKVTVNFPGKTARRYEFKVNPKLGWDDWTNCKPRKGSSFGMELVKAEEQDRGKFALIPTYYRIWRNGDPKLDARKCSGG